MSHNTTNNESSDGLNPTTDNAHTIAMDGDHQTPSSSSIPYVPINREVIREDMVQTAVNFMMNPRVMDSPLHQKRTFLLRKGLSLEEIDAAIDRSNRLHPNRSHPSLTSPVTAGQHPMPIGPSFEPSFLVKSTQLMSSIAVFGSVIYGAYVLYKRFIEPIIFDTKSKPHPYVVIQQQLDQLSKAMTLLQTNMSSIETNIKRQIETELRLMKAPEDVSLYELKSELASIKALLVSKRQFAPTPAAGIPLWQLNDHNKANKLNDDCEQQLNGSVDDNKDNSSDDDISHPIINGSVEPSVTEVVANGLQE